MSKSIIITGGNGFIGEELVMHFAKKNWKVRAFVHSDPRVKIPGVEYKKYSLEDELKEIHFDGVDFVVHCAFIRFDRNRRADSINLAGTKRLIDICRKRSVNLIYLSSFSAHENAQSHYGKTKVACERLFDLSKDLILRPGLVMGKRGLGAEMISRIRNSASVPLAGGDKPIQTIAVEDLCGIIERTMNTGDIGLYHVAEPKAITLKEFYTEIAAQLGKKIRFTPVPLWFVLLACRTAELFRVKLPVTSENVLGLQQLIEVDTTGDLRALNVSVKNYKENIRSVLK